MEAGMMLFINCEDCPVEEQIKTLKSIGVKHVFIGASHPRTPEILELVRREGLICDNFHGAFNETDGYRMDDMHKEGENGDVMLERLMNNISRCAEYKVPKLVVHISDDVPEITINPVGDARYKKLGDFARENNVTLVFENTAGFLENFENIWKIIPDAEFCWDNGHQFRFSRDVKLMKYFGNRLGALHITDNSGVRDDHYLPFDGVIDYEEVAKDIAESGYDGTMMLEAMYKDTYAEEMTYEEFAVKGKNASEKLIEMVEKYKGDKCG